MPKINKWTEIRQLTSNEMQKRLDAVNLDQNVLQTVESISENVKNIF